MANGKCAVIGDRDSILLFKAVGIEVYPVTDGEQANKTLHRLARTGTAGGLLLCRLCRYIGGGGLLDLFFFCH